MVVIAGDNKYSNLLNSDEFVWLRIHAKHGFIVGNVVPGIVCGVVVLVSASCNVALGWSISYKNSGIMGTETNKIMDLISWMNC